MPSATVGCCCTGCCCCRRRLLCCCWLLLLAALLLFVVADPVAVAFLLAALSLGRLLANASSSYPKFAVCQIASLVVRKRRKADASASGWL